LISYNQFVLVEVNKDIAARIAKRSEPEDLQRLPVDSQLNGLRKFAHDS
jgi:hypothetical protein